jgi:GT2 family glycosyltransferase
VTGRSSPAPLGSAVLLTDGAERRATRCDMGFAHDGVRHLDAADALLAEPSEAAPMVVLWRNGFPVGHRLRGVDGIVRRNTTELPSPAIGATASKTSVSVVVCTRDRPEELRRCLGSLPCQSLTPAEIVVVDNASAGDATRRVAEEAGVTYVREDRPGLDYARNTGARRAIGDIVAYTDDDVRLHPRWLERLVAAFDAPQIGAVTGLVLPAELATQAQLHFETFWSFGRGYDRKDYTSEAFQAASGVFPAWEIGAGASMAFRREVFDRAGLFDERLDVGRAGCSGDSEFWYRLLSLGYACRYEPTSVAFHYHRRTMDGLASQLFHYMRGHSAALLVQHERTGRWSNLRRAAFGIPAWYLRRAIRPMQPRDRFLKEEAAGLISGIGFYLRTPRHE